MPGTNLDRLELIGDLGDGGANDGLVERHKEHAKEEAQDDSDRLPQRRVLSFLGEPIAWRGVAVVARRLGLSIILMKATRFGACDKIRKCPIGGDRLGLSSRRCSGYFQLPLHDGSRWPKSIIVSASSFQPLQIDQRSFKAIAPLFYTGLVPISVRCVWVALISRLRETIALTAEPTSDCRWCR